MSTATDKLRELQDAGIIDLSLNTATLTRKLIVAGGSKEPPPSRPVPTPLTRALWAAFDRTYARWGK